MKEATGELNMTVVIVLAVAILSVFFFAILWPSIKNTFIATNKCSDAVCRKTPDSNGMVECFYYKNGRQEGNSFKCPWKG